MILVVKLIIFSVNTFTYQPSQRNALLFLRHRGTILREDGVFSFVILLAVVVHCSTFWLRLHVFIS